MTDKNTYAGIDVLEGLLGIRHNLGMYLGSTGLHSPEHSPRALIQTAEEVVANSADEYIAGYGEKITITVHADNSITIKDNGRGMPKGVGNSFDDVYNALTKSHASGKTVNPDAYNGGFVSGLHGIGLKATNAASRYLHIEAIAHTTKKSSTGKKQTDGGLEHYILHLVREDITKKEIVKVWKPNELTVKDNKYYDKKGVEIKTGTTIHYLPDDGPISERSKKPVFESIHWVNSDLFEKFRYKAYLNKALEVEYIDEREVNDIGEPLKRSWKYDNGLTDYVERLTEGNVTYFTKPLEFDTAIETEYGIFGIEGALNFTDDIATSISSFANGVRTKEGGPHEDGFNAGIVKAVNDLGKAKNIIKRESLKQSDVLEGCTAAFHIKVPAEIFSFEGQTKEKLGTAEAKGVVQDFIYTLLTNWLSDNEKIAKDLINQMLTSKSAREAAERERRAAKKAKQTKGGSKLELSTKLKKASSRKPSEKELFIVEGDSASEIGRDPKTQAVFPIKGKMKNTFDKNLGAILKNTEIATIATAIEAGIGPAFNLDDMAYHKIIIASDPDPDGAHIRMLVMTLFYKFFPGLIEAGRLYAVIPPLYKATKYTGNKRDMKVFYTEDEMNKARSSLKGYQIQRFKGLGEMNPDEVHFAVANPNTRRLMQILPGDKVESREMMQISMGNESKLRSDWIDENVDFNALYDEL